MKVVRVEVMMVRRVVVGRRMVGVGVDGHVNAWLGGNYQRRIYIIKSSII